MIKDKGLEIGHVEERYVSKITVEMMEDGLANRQGQLEKSQKKLVEKEKELAVIGKKPFLTAEMNKLRDNWMKLNQVDAFNKLESEIAPLRQQVFDHEKFIKERRVLIDSAPK